MSNEQQATIKEVARLAGVAASSVSRALNDHPDVSPEMRARVMKAVEQLGYRPDFLAQSLRLGASRTVGFIVRDISNALFAGIVMGAEKELDRNGYSILLMNSLGDPLLDAKNIDVLRQRRVDGLILSLQSESQEETVSALRRLSTPVVLLDREVRGIRCDAVLFDHAKGVSDATEALLRLGHRRIALIVGDSETRGSRDRVAGYLRAFSLLGLTPCDKDIVDNGSYSRDFGYSATMSALNSSKPPTALIAGNGQVGERVLAALNEVGLHHGEDIALVVCDDHELLRLMDPPVSVVARSAEQMGIAAAQLLLNRLQDGDSPLRNMVLPTVYLPRGSTSPPRKSSSSTAQTAPQG